MIARPASESPFCESNRNLQYAWDSVSMTTFMECPRKYQLQILQGLRPLKAAPELDFGLAFHKLAEGYHSLPKDLTPEEKLHATIKKAIELGQALPPDPKELRTPFILLRTIVWYIDKFGDNDPLRTYIMPSGKPATELSFRIALPLINPDGEPYIYCGHIDRIAAEGLDNTLPLVTDYKSTGSSLGSFYFSQFDSSWQITGYIFAASTLVPETSNRAVIDAAQLAKGFTRFGRSFTERHPEVISEWHEDFMEWIRLAETYAEQNYWPKNRTSCAKFGGCPFVNVCNSPPGVLRDLEMSSGFEVRPWNPLENR